MKEVDAPRPTARMSSSDRFSHWVSRTDLTADWIRFNSPRWQSTSKPSTYPDGSVHQRPHHHWNQDQILPVRLLIPSLSPLRPKPELVDYPSNTVPNKVAQLFTAQLFHDRKQRFTRTQAISKGDGELEKLGPSIDYLRPIVADADTGHGGQSCSRW